MTHHTHDHLELRDVIDADLDTFFEFQLDPQANQMAAFTGDDPTDRDAFNEHWQRIRKSPNVTIKAILVDHTLVGHIASFNRDGDREVTYWLGRDHWGRGIATAALAAFLKQERTRPLYGRVAADNTASKRVLEKCGFAMHAEEMGFANARGEEIREFVFVLDGEPQPR